MNMIGHIPRRHLNELIYKIIGEKIDRKKKRKHAYIIL